MFMKTQSGLPSQARLRFLPDLYGSSVRQVSPSGCVPGFV